MRKTPAKQLERNRKWRAANRDYFKKHHEKHKKKHAAYHKAWQQEHRAHLAEYNRAYYIIVTKPKRERARVQKERENAA